MTVRRQHEHELEQWGTVQTDRMKYAPLEEVRVRFTCRSRSDGDLFVRVYDGAGRQYARQTMTLRAGVGELTVTAGGTPGMHVIRLFENDIDTAFWSYRMGTFQVEARTHASAPGTGIGEFFDWLGPALAASLDWALYDGKWIAGDKAADNSPMNLAYPRFRLDTTVYLDPAEVLKGHLELCYAHAWESGMLPDHIYGDHHPGWDGEWQIRTLMADMETGLIINVWQVWMATGDTQWMAGLLEPMLRGWRWATTSPELWDENLGLIKKPHAADEWDCQMGDGSNFRNENSRYVATLCDAVRMPWAGDRLAEMLAAVGREDEAAELRAFAAAARERANALLWDGAKYRHHEHIDPVEHGDFDEDAQLVMSNTWACNYGLASHEQAVAIIAEYERRLRETGDAFPWWSLQPPYPEGHFPRHEPGVYLNGGLFPWVGGQLCRACFQHGLPERGWRLLREFWDVVQAEGGACPTWFTLDGRAAANTVWTTRWDAWGIAAWGQAAIEGLVGVVAQEPAMERCVCAPQWAAGGVTEASACVAFPSSRTYLAYEFAQEGATTRLRFTGSGREVELRLSAARAAVRATLNGEPVATELRAIQGQEFWCLTADPAGVNELRLAAE